MNRAQRRKQGNKKPINYNRQQLEQVKKQIYIEASEIAFRLMLLIPVYTMRNHYKWGSKRISEFLDAVLETYNDYAEGERFDLYDLAETLEEETGVKFKERIEENEKKRQERTEKIYGKQEEI